MSRDDRLDEALKNWDFYELAKIYRILAHYCIHIYFTNVHIKVFIFMYTFATIIVLKMKL